MTASDPAPRPRSRLRRWLSPWNLVFVALSAFALARLAPHLGAVIGVRSGDDVVPAFSATTLDGVLLTSDSLRGKVVLVNFWATWCLPCRAEMPFLEAMWKRHRDRDFVILGLSVDRGGDDQVRRFVEDREITYPIARVGEDIETAFGGMRGIPTSFLLDREGRVRHRAIGPLAPLSFEPAVRRLMADRD